jgi:hypothetical protein
MGKHVHLVRDVEWSEVGGVGLAQQADLIRSRPAKRARPN